MPLLAQQKACVFSSKLGGRTCTDQFQGLPPTCLASERHEEYEYRVRRHRHPRPRTSCAFCPFSSAG